MLRMVINYTSNHLNEMDMLEESFSLFSRLLPCPRGGGGKLPNLLMLCLSLLLAGCGMISQYSPNPVEGNNASSSGKNAGGSPRPTSTPMPFAASTQAPVSSLGIDAARLRGVTVTFWHAWTGASGQTIDDLVEEFNRSNPWGVTVSSSAKGSYDQVSEQIALAQKNGDLPDITTAYLYQALAWRSSGVALVDLSPYVNDPVWGLDSQAQADFYPIIWEHDLLAGARYGIPAQGSAQMLYYNTTWAKELGFNDPPVTPEQFKAQACAAAQANERDNDPKNDHTGGYIISTQYSAVLGWMYAFGADIETANGQGYSFNSPPVQETFTYLRGLYDGGCAWLSENQTSEADFAARRGLLAAGSVAGILYQEDAFVQAGSQDEWSIIPFPSPNGKPVISVYNPSFQVLKSTPRQQLASWLFIRWLVEPAHQAQLAEVSGYYPVRASSLKLMGILPAAHPQWETAAEDLLKYARHEPTLPSWLTVRWAVSDAATQLFRYYFEPDQVPILVKLLDDTANDLNAKDK